MAEYQILNLPVLGVVKAGGQLNMSSTYTNGWDGMYVTENDEGDLIDLITVSGRWGENDKFANYVVTPIPIGTIKTAATLKYEGIMTGIVDKIHSMLQQINENINAHHESVDRLMESIDSGALKTSGISEKTLIEIIKTITTGA